LCRIHKFSLGNVKWRFNWKAAPSKALALLKSYFLQHDNFLLIQLHWNEKRFLPNILHSRAHTIPVDRSDILFLQSFFFLSGAAQGDEQLVEMFEEIWAEIST